MGCRASYGGMERKCRVTGDRCVFMIPDEKLCYELYGEGPLEYEKEKNIGIDLASGEDKTGRVKR
ncbi:TPA: hypothetical protein K8N36_000933 [Clostridium perfringens]|uniref:Uncharacterized protein n=1 Tax=Clostridium perfringens F262 TaxID=883064 RepID=A0AAV3FEB7_CLOPF|nr:hypothetical protein [Clostridium perfringens]UWG10008.1 MAG: hypothetical protein [Bacteriophage sp.]EIA17572.1 hypothetical protein HA1_06317 [Clostridium perfringens F262]MDK0680562.1 hypothetical protein [Clostridium perfringens]MDK0856767.1 hypothetical protein [Clostridium perfringens]MDM0592807.1 hypothetical protein [Clostridium perfringens]